MYQYKIQPTLQKIILRLYKKDKQSRERVLKKIQEIISSENIEHYKNLKKPLQHLKRIHIGEKVLVFKYDKKEKIVIFEDFSHHDKIYLR